jgi:RimJ/RimL family protein N-acetyltransferase
MIKTGLLTFLLIFCAHYQRVDAMSQQNHTTFTFKRVTPDDVPLLYTWFQEPHVKEWWPVPEKDDDFFAYFLPKIRSKDTFPFLVLMNTVPLGYIQYYYIDRTLEKAGSWLPELPSTTVGIDQFIGDINSTGKGYGTLLIKDFITYLAALEPTITTIILDPTPENHAAIRCYEKVDFKRVGEFMTPSGYAALLMRYDIQR